VTPQEVFQYIKANNIQIIDLKFTDLPGLWHDPSHTHARH